MTIVVFPVSVLLQFRNHKCSKEIVPSGINFQIYTHSKSYLFGDKLSIYYQKKDIKQNKVFPINSFCNEFSETKYTLYQILEAVDNTEYRLINSISGFSISLNSEDWEKLRLNQKSYNSSINEYTKIFGVLAFPILYVGVLGVLKKLNFNFKKN